MTHHRLSRFDTIVLIVGAIIGWGSFTLPGTRFLAGSGVINTAIGFIIGAIAVLFIQHGYHVMLEHHVAQGGESAYASRYLGRGHGFIVGWALVLTYTSMVALNSTAFVLVLKRIFGDTISRGYLYTVEGFGVYVTDILITSAVLVLFTWFNLRGLKTSARTGNILVLTLLTNVAILIVLMLMLSDTTKFTDTYITGWTIDWAQIASVIAIVPFLFVGFDVLPQVAKDLRYPPRQATRLVVLGIIVGAGLYIAMNTLTALALSPEEASAAEWATGTAVADVIGPIGFVMLVAALAGAVLGGLNAFTLAGSGLIASMAKNRFLPLGMADRNDRNVLSKAVLAILAVNLIAPWAGREVINYIVDMSSMLAAIAYGYTCFISTRIATTLISRVFSAIGLAFSIGFIALLSWPGSAGQLSTPAMVVLIIWLVLGSVVYLLGRRHKDELEISAAQWQAPEAAITPEA